MPGAETKKPKVEDQESIRLAADSGGGGSAANRRLKKRGNLAATLDPLLAPRTSRRQPGRPRGVNNYEWTPEIDKLLIELCANGSAAKAKYIIGRKIQESRLADVEPRADSVRKAVEYRMAKLGLSTGKKRKKPEMRNAKRWSTSETTVLLGALGADATIESIAARTGHTVKSVRAKLARLDYQVHEIHGFAEFAVDELADLIHVTPRQIRRWKEKGWLQTKHRKITDACLEQFLGEHADQIPFGRLTREEQVYLIDLGYTCPAGKTFQQNVREILNSVGRNLKPRRRASRQSAAGMATGDSGPDRDDGSPSAVEQSA
jgi:hypothetical protein